MQKFTRPLTREVELGGERLALTLDEKGVAIRTVGSRRPPREVSWAALLVFATGHASATGSVPGPEDLAAAVKTLKGGGGAPPAPSASMPSEAAPRSSSEAPPSPPPEPPPMPPLV